MCTVARRANKVRPMDWVEGMLMFLVSPMAVVDTVGDVCYDV